jgi:hypothetical protein
MATVTEIPTLSGRPFSEIVTWQGASYTLHFKWNRMAQYWLLDIWDGLNAAPILSGLAVVTGCDVLEQFAYLPLAAHTIITVMTIGPANSPDQIPNFTNLGGDGRVYLVLP